MQKSKLIKDNLYFGGYLLVRGYSIFLKCTSQFFFTWKREFLYCHLKFFFSFPHWKLPNPLCTNCQSFEFLFHTSDFLLRISGWEPLFLNMDEHLISKNCGLLKNAYLIMECPVMRVMSLWNPFIKGISIKVKQIEKNFLSSLNCTMNFIQSSGNKINEYFHNVS